MKIKRINESIISEATLEQELNKEVSKAQREIDNAEVATKGIIENTLDRALKTALRQKKNGGDAYTNVLFIGEAGTGKTSRIRAWAKANNINLYEVRCAGMDDTDLGGAISPDSTGTTVTRLASTEFDKLDRPRSVLFLDEYNRARSSVRTNLLELVNSHAVPDPREPGGQRILDNFLFTVAAINPASVGFDTDALDRAELSRFKSTYVPVETGTLLSYLKRTLTKELDQADSDEEKLEIQGRLSLAEVLLGDEGIDFDSKESLDKAMENAAFNGLPLNNRSFTNLLNYCDGTKDDFIANWSDFCNNLKLPEVKAALENYVDVKDKANSVFDDEEDSEVFSAPDDLFSIMSRQVKKSL